MKPLNEKERTNAFIQFIALLTITLILAMAYVIVNPQVKSSDDKMLREENKRYKNSMNDAKYNPINTDSLIIEIDKIDKMTQSDYDNKRTILFDFLKENTIVTDRDTLQVDRMKIGLANITKRWIYDKQRVINYEDKDKLLKTSNDNYNTLNATYIELKSKYDALSKQN